MLTNRDINRKISIQNVPNVEEYRKLHGERVKRKKVYESPEGLEMLLSDLLNSGFFDLSYGENGQPEDNSRNFMIQRLESMGILDEDNIKRLVWTMVYDTEVVPEPERIGLRIEDSDGD